MRRRALLRGRVPGRYRRGMQAVPRFAGGDPGIIADAGMGIAAAGLTAVAAWGPPGLIGPAIAGPTWLRALLPLLMGASLVLRRRSLKALVALLGEHHQDAQRVLQGDLRQLARGGVDEADVLRQQGSTEASVNGTLRCHRTHVRCGTKVR